MSSDRLKIIYIAGAGRSGSTLLSNVLGQLPGVVSIGELYYLWERGIQDNILCGCGNPFRDCEYWQEVLQCTGLSTGIENIPQAFANGVNGARTRHIPFLFTKGGRLRYATVSQPFINLLDHIFKAISQLTGCNCIVDASKFPSYGFLLTQIPNVEVSVIHLIRDPRAVGFSWQRRKFNPDSGELFGRMSISRSAAIWNSWNVGAEILGHTVLDRDRFLRLQYEQFINHPASSLERIINMARLDIDPKIVVQDQTVIMKQEHTIGGNPVRFNKSMTLKLDMDWQTAMPIFQQTLTTVITWPLLRRYGYPSR